MFRLDPHPPSQSPARLLRPWAVLERLRPAKLAAFHLRLREYERLSLGLNLIQHHFPPALVEYDDLSGKGWWEILAHLANLVEEAEWFEINWPVLNEAWSHWMNDPEEEQGDHLAVFLHYLPVVLYGFTDGESLFEFPPMELLHTLLVQDSYEAGELICEEGQPADQVYFLVAGRVSASVRLDHKRRHRLSASAAGTIFGESALFEKHFRNADIIADTAVQVFSLEPGRLLELEDPLATRVKMKLLSNLSELSVERLGRVNQEVRILTS